MGIPGDSDSKKYAFNAGYPVSISRSRRSSREENGYRIQYSSMENPIDNGAQWDVVLLMLFSCSVMSDSLRPHGLQHISLPCPSLSPTVCSNSCTLSQ